MQLHSLRTQRPRRWQRSGLRWLVTFAGFPLGGLLAELIVGPVDGVGAAVAGGALTGLVLGAVQAWALATERLVPEAWIGATAAGFAIGLGIGAAAVGYGTSAGDLAIQGAICGLAVGAAQALVLRRRLGPLAFAWPPALAAIWALGWTVTTAIGVDVESQYTVFGSSGALVVTLLTAALPITMARRAEASAS
jgi:hypothetical protein